MKENGAIKVFELVLRLVPCVLSELRILKSQMQNLIYHAKWKKNAKSWKNFFFIQR
jgi:hypothetical protein